MNTGPDLLHSSSIHHPVAPAWIQFSSVCTAAAIDRRALSQSHLLPGSSIRGFLHQSDRYMSSPQVGPVSLTWLWKGLTLRTYVWYVWALASEVKPVEDGLLAVSLIGRVGWLISGPEAWISHGAAHPEEDFNVSLGSRCVYLLQRAGGSQSSPTTDVKQRASRRGFWFSSVHESTLAHPGSPPSSFDLPLSITGVNVNHHQSSADGSVLLSSMDEPLVHLHVSCEGSINRDYPRDILTNGAKFSCRLCPPPSLISHFIPVDFFPSYSASFCQFLSPPRIWSAIVSPWRENIASLITPP